jgi:intracellular multiplication protein IcmQ
MPTAVIAMPLSDEELKANLVILKELDDLLASGPWERNLFFKGIGKKLKDARDRFVQELGLEKTETTSEIPQELPAADYQDIYISLYQAEGTDLKKWQVVVNSLAGYNVTRPVYRSEEDVKASINTKAFKQNDAYAVIRIRKDDIKKITDAAPKDRLGHELLVLRENAIKLENILRFVHMNDEYHYKNGILSKKVQ